MQKSDLNDPSKKNFCDDNTTRICNGFSDGRAYCIHCCLVLSPVGENLSTFTSLGKLVAALRDVVVGMYVHHHFYLPCLYSAIVHKACCEKGILH